MANTCKYYKQKKQVSYDNGVTWQDVVPAEYQKGSLYESQSIDCSYTPLSGKFNATYFGGINYFVDCNDSTTLTTGETKPVGYESSAMTSAVIGDCVTSIGNNAFWGCSSLTRLNSSVGGVANIPSGVTSIGHGAFIGCSSLTRINIPSGVTNIKGHTFWGCESLTDLTIPDSVTTIGDAIINYCKNLNSVTIGNSVTSIGDNAFLCYHNSVLSSITINAITPPTLGTGAFDYTNNCPIYVPSEAVNTYKTAPGWSEYTSRLTAIS